MQKRVSKSKMPNVAPPPARVKMSSVKIPSQVKKVSQNPKPLFPKNGPHRNLFPNFSLPKGANPKGFQNQGFGKNPPNK